MLGSLHPILPGVCQKCTRGTGLVGCCPEPIPFPVDPLPFAGLPKDQRISRCKLVFLIGAAGDDLQSIIRRRTLQRLRVIPRRPHPDVALFVRGHDHRHSLGMDRLNARCFGATIRQGVNKMKVYREALDFVPV
jgi:hypothetical protein